jgi:hypothetical protein
MCNKYAHMAVFLRIDRIISEKPTHITQYLPIRLFYILQENMPKNSRLYNKKSCNFTKHTKESEINNINHEMIKCF